MCDFPTSRTSGQAKRDFSLTLYFNHQFCVYNHIPTAQMNVEILCSSPVKKTVACIWSADSLAASLLPRIFVQTMHLQSCGKLKDFLRSFLPPNVSIFLKHPWQPFDMVLVDLTIDLSQHPVPLPTQLLFLCQTVDIGSRL